MTDTNSMLHELKLTCYTQLKVYTLLGPGWRSGTLK